MNEQLIIETYNEITKYINNNYKIVLNRLLLYNDIDREDLVQDLIITYMNNTDLPIKELCDTELLRLLRTYKKECIDDISLDYLVSKGFDISIDKANQNASNNISDDAYINTVYNTKLLTSDDWLVLKGILTRQQVADKLNISYDAYRKRLWRKTIKIKKDLKNM